MKIYEVVGWRKEYYLRCKREVWERQERLRDFLQRELGIDREDVASYSTSSPEATIENPGKYEHLRDRKDIRFRLTGYDFLKGKYHGAEITPNRRTKAGKELTERWRKALAGDFGLIFHPTRPFFLRVSQWNCRREDEPYINPHRDGGLSAKVIEENGRLFLVDWKGFDPEKMEGFEPVEVSVG